MSSSSYSGNRIDFDRHITRKSSVFSITSLYWILLFVFFGVLTSSCFHSYQELVASESKIELEGQNCFLKYESKQCTQTLLTDECKILFECLKKRPEGSSILSILMNGLSKFFLNAELTIVRINENALGPTIIMICLFTLRLVHITEKRNKGETKIQEDR